MRAWKSSIRRNHVSCGTVCVCACAFVRTCNYAILADSLKRLQTLYWVSLTLVALQDSGLKLLEREVVGNY